MKPERLYRCPVCGDIVSEQEIEESMQSGGMGMCYCQYKDGQRILIEYDVYHLIQTAREKDV